MPLSVLAACLGMTAVAGAAPIQWTEAAGGNGNYYEVFSTRASVSWTDAKTSAEAQSFLGMTGYLATITSAEENSFITANFNDGSFGLWIGASDADSEGVWRWVTGPEAGAQFWAGGPDGTTTGPFNFANWANAPSAGFVEPSNSCSRQA
jgi:endo-beta-N-acetylglucosaminidase D